MTDVAAAPGAGFAETKEFLRVFQSEPVTPPAWEQKLWHWYDSTDYALNLFNLPTVAYSGEIDKQKQAADMMAASLKEEGIELTHIIGTARPIVSSRVRRQTSAASATTGSSVLLLRSRGPRTGTRAADAAHLGAGVVAITCR